MEGEHLAAVCGLYCGACPVYRAARDENRQQLEELAKVMSQPPEDIRCDGCLSQGCHTDHYQECRIRQCAADKPGVERCSDCPEFPCSLITNFSDDGVPHHGAVLKNIRRQQELGVYEWLQEEYERVRCQYCGVSLDWYAQSCHRCGIAQPFTLPSMLGDGSRLEPYYYKG